jgi:hypothetical protein
MTIATNTKVISYPVYVDLLNAPTKTAHTYAGTYTATATITLSTTT